MSCCGPSAATKASAKRCSPHDDNLSVNNLPKGWLSLAPSFCTNLDDNEVQPCKRQHCDESPLMQSSLSSGMSLRMPNLVLDLLPDSCLVAICAKLSAKDRLAFALTCNKFYRISSLSQKYLCVRTNPGNFQFKQVLSRFRNVEELELSFHSGTVPMTDDSCVVLSRSNLPLVSLNLDGQTEISDEGFVTILAAFRNLRVVSISGCSKITDNGIRSLARSAQNLKSLNIYNCKSLSYSSLEVLATQCSALETLESSELNCFPDSWKSLKSLSLSCYACECTSTIKSISLSCPTLELLSLKFFCSINYNEAFGGIRDKCPFLKSLKLESCTGVTLELFDKPWPSLTEITIQSADVTDQVLAKIGESCPQLTHASFVSCADITDAGVAAFMKLATLLESLDVSLCPRITHCSVVALASARGSRLVRICLPRQSFGMKHLKIVSKHGWQVDKSVSVWKLIRGKPCVCSSCK